MTCGPPGQPHSRSWGGWSLGQAGPLAWSSERLVGLTASNLLRGSSSLVENVGSGRFKLILVAVVEGVEMENTPHLGANLPLLHLELGSSS